jgi:hypothetical protein
MKMRCLQFDKEVFRALLALGFIVADDYESASTETTVDLIHPAGNKHFLLIVSLPCGGNLTWELTRERLLDHAAEQIESHD